MILTNFHTHCYYCDGKGSPEQMLESATQLGFQAVGFSSHAPLPFDNNICMPQEKLTAYLAHITKLKNSMDIDVYLGLEIDYIRGLISPSDKMWHSLNLDYRIGSVHVLDPPSEARSLLTVDGPHDEFSVLLNDVYQGDVRLMVETYYQRVAQLCGEGGFDILGHYDLVKKHNQAFSLFDENETWYKDVAIATLDAVAKAGVILEVNYGGILRGATQDVYPSPWLLKEARAKNIAVQINADAHAPEHLGVYHQRCREILSDAGYTTQRVLLGGQWQDIEIHE